MATKKLGLFFTNLGRLAKFATSHIIGRENKKTNNKTLLLEIKNLFYKFYIFIDPLFLFYIIFLVILDNLLMSLIYFHVMGI